MPRAAVLIVLGSALLAFQLRFMEERKEVRDEQRYETFTEDVGSALMTYTALLFTGSFRSLASDMLWVFYERAVEKNEYDRAVQYSTLLLTLQSTNPGVYEHLSHDYTHNMPAVSPPQDRWPLIKKGYLTLARGALEKVRNSPHLHAEMGYRLYQKVSWDRPVLQLELIGQFESEADLQSKLWLDLQKDPEMRPHLTFDPAGRAPGAVGGRSPYELAIPWLLKAADLAKYETQRQGLKAYYNQMGLLVDPASQHGMVWHAMFYQANLEWLRGRHEAALWWLRERTIPFNRWYLEHYREQVGTIYTMRMKMAEDLAGLVELHARLVNTRNPEVAPAFLDQALRFMTIHETLDEQFVKQQWETLRQVILKGTARELGWGPEIPAMEEGELDDFPWCSNRLMRRISRRWIWPSESDVDLYFRPPSEGEPERLRFTITNRPHEKVPGRHRLHVRVVREDFDPRRGLVMTTLDDTAVDPGNTFLFDKTVERSGYVLLYISALDGTFEAAPYELVVD